MTKAVPYDWLKQLPAGLLKLDNIPLSGYAPPFPWEKLSEELAKTFQIEGFDIKPVNQQWREAGSLYSGLAKNLIPINVVASPLAGSITWVLPESEIAKLMGIFIAKEGTVYELLDKETKQGFYRFLAIMAINAVGRIGYDKGLSPQIQEGADLPKQDAFTIDVAIEAGGRQAAGRLILGNEFLHSWRERHAAKGPALLAESPILEKIDVVVHLEAGKTTLKKSELAAIRPGDFLLLDQCSYEPDSDKARVMITLNGTPVFRGKIKQGNLKILEYPLYHEVDTNMNARSDDEEDSLFSDDDSTAEDFDADFETNDFETEFTEEEAAPPPKAKAAPLPPKQSAPQEKQGAGAQIATQDIPLTVVVEVARLQMSLQKLMELQPGNLLELDIRPEDGIDLVVNGKRIAKGELLRVGEALGVRITDIT